MSWNRGGDTETLTGAPLLSEAARRNPAAGVNPDGAFVRAVRDGTPTDPDMRSALRAHAVVDACYLSAAQGGAMVRVDETSR